MKTTDRMKSFIKKAPRITFPKLKLKNFEAVEEFMSGYSPAAVEELKQKHPVFKRSGEYEGTDYKDVKEIFERSTSLFADRPLILQKFNRKGSFEEITYGQFRKDVIALGTGLTKVFKLQGEKILVLSETTYEWYVSYMALLCGAGIAVPTDKELPDNELENIIKRSGAAAVICSPKKKGQVDKVLDHCPSVKYVMEMYSDDPINGRHVGLDFVKEEGSVLAEYGDHSFMDIEIDPEAFAVLLFTSGTTSQSKGVMLCERNLAANVNGITPYVDLTPEDRMFSILPLHHTYESTIGFIYPFAVGASIVVCQGLKHIVDNMQETQPTAMLAVPLLIETLYKRINKAIEKSGKAGMVNSMMGVTNILSSMGVDIRRKVFKEILSNLGGKIRIIVSAAAPIDPTVGKWVEDLGIMFLQGYGLTETAPITGVTPDFDRRVGSAGKVVHGNEVRIEEPNADGEGEIWIKGATVMMGYYEDPEETSKAIVDGWFNSGDIGYMDEDNYVYITGRSKNVIVTQNGKNIYPEEIEGLLSRVEEIAECMVYGQEDEGKELVITCRAIPNLEKIKELHAGEFVSEEPSDEEVYKIIMLKIREVNRLLSNYKAMKRLEIKKDAFEKTSTMKIKRYAELKKDAILFTMDDKRKSRKEKDTEEATE